MSLSPTLSRPRSLAKFRPAALLRLLSRPVQIAIAIALGLKLAVFALALGGYATLWMAIAGDMGASLIVIFNGLRALRQ